MAKRRSTYSAACLAKHGKEKNPLLSTCFTERVLRFGENPSSRHAQLLEVFTALGGTPPPPPPTPPQHLVGPPSSPTNAFLLFPRTAFSLFEELSSTPSTPQPERVGKLGVGKRGCLVHHGSSKTVGSKLFSVWQVSARLQSGLMREADNGTSFAGR